MKKTIKSFTLVLIAAILCFSYLCPVLANSKIPNPTSDFYVNDFANIFSDEEKASLMASALELAKSSDGIQVVISTIESLNGDTVENYALNMYNLYGIGKDDMGLLILLSTKDRKIRIEVGREMEAYINDSKAGRFMDKYAIPYLKENKFNEGLINLHQALITEINNCITSEENASTVSDTNPMPDINWGLILIVIGFIFLVILFIYIVTLIKNKIKKRKDYITSLNDEIAELKSTNDNLKSSFEIERANLNSTIQRLTREKSNLNSNLSDTKNNLFSLQDRYSRVQKLFPDADSKVDEMIKKELIEKDKQAAKKVDALISSVITLKASKDIVNKLSNVISNYESLTKSQKQYITSDVKQLNTLYNSSVNLKQEYEKALEEERVRKLIEQRKQKAASVTKEIIAVISGISFARASHLYQLRAAKDLYEDLDYETQKYVDDATISKLDSLISAAKRDKEEEEDRRRRESTYNSMHSSHSSGGSFGGFGGNSGGGGASRGF